jgi:hypothetical protein
MANNQDLMAKLQRTYTKHVNSRRNMILKPSLSFAGPREYRWQGLEVPAIMRKRRGTAQIATASPAGCATGNRHKNLLFSQLDRSLCTADETYS